MLLMRFFFVIPPQKDGFEGPFNTLTTAVHCITNQHEVVVLSSVAQSRRRVDLHTHDDLPTTAASFVKYN